MESRGETEKKTTRNLQIMPPCHGTLFFLTLLSLSRVDLDVTSQGMPQGLTFPPSSDGQLLCKACEQLGLGIREEEQGQELGMVQVGKSRRAQKGGGGGNITGTWLLAKMNNVKEQGQVKKSTFSLVSALFRPRVSTFTFIHLWHALHGRRISGKRSEGPRVHSILESEGGW